MKAVQITETDNLQVECQSAEIGEWVSIPDCIPFNAGDEVLVVCGKWDKWVKINGFRIKAVIEESPEAAIQDAIEDGLSEDLNDWKA